MTSRAVKALGVALAVASAGTPAEAARERPLVSLSASPAHVTFSRARREAIKLTNFGASRVVVDASVAGVGVDLRGRPTLVRRPAAGRNAAAWLRVRPRRLVIPSHRSASVSVELRLPRRAQPGDHQAAVVLATRAVERRRIGVRMRVAVRVAVRAPGRVTRRLAIRALRVRRNGGRVRFEVRLLNHGNVTEPLSGRVAIELATPRRRVVRIPAARRELLPGRSAIVSVRYHGRRAGVIRARVVVRGAGARTFRIRL